VKIKRMCFASSCGRMRLSEGVHISAKTPETNEVSPTGLWADYDNARSINLATETGLVSHPKHLSWDEDILSAHTLFIYQSFYFFSLPWESPFYRSIFFCHSIGTHWLYSHSL